METLVLQGFEFRNLKYSRDNESEADRMGLIFAAMAGYNPQVAISFWKTMAMQSASKKPEFMSDHPSDEKRIAQIKKEMPEALKYYKPQIFYSTSSKTVKSGKAKSVLKRNQ